MKVQDAFLLVSLVGDTTARCTPTERSPLVFHPLLAGRQGIPPKDRTQTQLSFTRNPKGDVGVETVSKVSSSSVRGDKTTAKTTGSGA